MYKSPERTTDLDSQLRLTTSERTIQLFQGDKTKVVISETDSHRGVHKYGFPMSGQRCTKAIVARRADPGLIQSPRATEILAH